MIISRKKQPILPDSPLSVNNHSLERVTSYKYLNVWLTSTLNWSIQVSKVRSRARKQIGFIYRKFYGHANSSTLLQFYSTYVCPLLEYAAPVWDPHHQGLIDSLERVQKFALRLCLRDWNAGYNSLLQSCNLPTLTHRRRQLSCVSSSRSSTVNLTSPELPSFHATWLTTCRSLVHFYFRDHHLPHLFISFHFFHMLLHSGTSFFLQSVVVPLCIHLNATYPYFRTYNL